MPVIKNELHVNRVAGCLKTYSSSSLVGNAVGFFVGAGVGAGVGGLHTLSKSATNANAGCSAWYHARSCLMDRLMPVTLPEPAMALQTCFCLSISSSVSSSDVGTSSNNGQNRSSLYPRAAQSSHDIPSHVVGTAIFSLHASRSFLVNGFHSLLSSL